MAPLRYHWGLLLQYRGILMGLLTLLVIFCRFNSEARSLGVQPWILKPIRFSDCSVDAFLMLSGIGLYCSYTKTPKLGTFYKKRAIRVLVPCLIITFFFLLWRYTAIEPSVSGFFMEWLMPNFFIHGSGTSYVWFWFGTSILVLYLFFPLVYRIIQKPWMGIACIAVVIALTVALDILAPGTFSAHQRELTRIPIFILGAMCGKLCINQKSFGRTPKGYRWVTFWLVIITCAVAGIILVMRVAFGIGIHNLLFYYWRSILGIDICVIGAMFFEKIHRFLPQWLEKGLITIGGVSLEVYLIHWGLVHVLEQYFTLSSFGEVVVTFLGIAVISIFLSLLLQLVLGKFFPLKRKIK